MSMNNKYQIPQFSYLEGHVNDGKLGIETGSLDCDQNTSISLINYNPH